MSRMSELAMEVEDLLFDGFTAAEVAERLNMPVEMVDEVIQQIEAAYEADGQPSEYEEWQDVYGGDDAFETCSYCEDF